MRKVILSQPHGRFPRLIGANRARGRAAREESGGARTRMPRDVRAERDTREQADAWSRHLARQAESENKVRGECSPRDVMSAGEPLTRVPRAARSLIPRMPASRRTDSTRPARPRWPPRRPSAVVLALPASAALPAAATAARTTRPGQSGACPSAALTVRVPTRTPTTRSASGSGVAAATPSPAWPPTCGRPRSCPTVSKSSAAKASSRSKRMGTRPS